MNNVPFDPEMLSHLEGVSDEVIIYDLAANYTQQQLQRMVSSARRLAELATAELADQVNAPAFGPLPQDVEHVLRMIHGEHPRLEDIQEALTPVAADYLHHLVGYIEDVLGNGSQRCTCG